MTLPVVYATTRPIPPEALAALFAHTTWANDRSADDVARLLPTAGISVGAWSGDSLVGYARALSDGLYRAFIDDVVVDAAFRGRGVGQGLMQALLACLDGVEEIHLGCGDELVPFYESLGFRRTGGANLRYQGGSASAPSRGETG